MCEQCRAGGLMSYCLDDEQTRLRKRGDMTETGEGSPSLANETWVITVAGYGSFDFHGTEREAEEMRRHKSRWEGAVATKKLKGDK